MHSLFHLAADTAHCWKLLPPSFVSPVLVDVQADLRDIVGLAPDHYSKTNTQ